MTNRIYADPTTGPVGPPMEQPRGEYPPGGVAGGLDRLQDLLDDMEKALETLRSRIEPVIRPAASRESSPSDTAGAELVGESPGSHLATRLESLGDQIHHNTRRIKDLTGRVDL